MKELSEYTFLPIKNRKFRNIQNKISKLSHTESYSYTNFILFQPNLKEIKEFKNYTKIKIIFLLILITIITSPILVNNNFIKFQVNVLVEI